MYRIKIESNVREHFEVVAKKLSLCYKPLRLAQWVEHLTGKPSV